MNFIHTEGFPKQYRIRNTNHFHNLFKTGRKSHLESVSIITTENYLGHARLGIAISKRFIPKAVDRNKLKRILREFFRKKKQLIGPQDLLIICKQTNRGKLKRYKAEDIQFFFEKTYDKKNN